MAIFEPSWYAQAKMLFSLHELLAIGFGYCNKVLRFRLKKIDASLKATRESKKIFRWTSWWMDGPVLNCARECIYDIARRFAQVYTTSCTVNGEQVSNWNIYLWRKTIIKEDSYREFQERNYIDHDACCNQATHDKTIIAATVAAIISERSTNVGFIRRVVTSSASWFRVPTSSATGRYSARTRSDSPQITISRNNRSGVETDAD